MTNLGEGLEDDEDDYDEDGDDDEDEDEDDEDEDEPAQITSGKPDENPPECKQQ